MVITSEVNDGKEANVPGQNGRSRVATGVKISFRVALFCTCWAILGIVHFVGSMPGRKRFSIRQEVGLPGQGRISVR